MRLFKEGRERRRKFLLNIVTRLHFEHVGNSSIFGRLKSLTTFYEASE